MTFNLKNLKKEFNNRISINQDLSKYSWFNLGGPAEILFKPDNVNEIRSLLKKYKKNITILGAGSNTLIRDGGVRNLTIKLSPKFSYIKILSDNIIEVGAATLDKRLSNFATQNSISGFEFLSCIPGNIGGAIKMNCGCYGHDISNILHSVLAVDFNGEVKEILAKDINFKYRGTDLPENLIFISAKFKGNKSSKEKIKKKQDDFLKTKKRVQPGQVKTCGSTFKNPDNYKAWELIKKSECSNYNVGGAIISQKHCNFFIDNGNATSIDMENLIKKVKEKVYNNTKINLELEIKIIGDNI